jgi:signal transduction histidine kinase
METTKHADYEFKDAGDSPTEQFFAKNINEIKNILDAISIGILFLNKTKRHVFFANKYFYSTSQTIRDEILATICEFLDKNIDKPTHLNRKQEVMITRDGEELIFGFTVHRITQDITGIFFSETTSRTIYIESKQKNQFYDELSELVGEIAHEIGNPLSGISVSLQLLIQNLSDWPLEKIKNHIERNITEINRLADFLKRIRQVSNRDKVSIKETNLKEIIDKVLTQFEPHLKLKKISYRNMVDKNITVLVDEEAFHRILLNLFSNSLRILSADNEIKIYVEDISNLYVTLVYQNDGEPIPEELIEKIFSPFFTTSNDGDGLGLAISLKLMTQMGGSIRAVPPKDGIGAKFLLHIPYD